MRENSPARSARAPSRSIIINADDFGLSEGVNRGIIEAHENGVLASASLMVRYPAAAAAAESARAHPRLSVGLHFELGEWRFAEGEWRQAYRVADANNAEAIRREFAQQLAAFEKLMGQKPTHLDSHQHAHLSEPCRGILADEAARLGVPLRACDPAIKHCGNFYGQTAEGAPFPEGISLARMTELLQEIDSAWTELGCHPGYSAGLDSVYANEREEELRVLCGAELRETIEQLELRLASFHDYRAQKKGAAERLLEG